MLAGTFFFAPARRTALAGLLTVLLASAQHAAALPPAAVGQDTSIGTAPPTFMQIAQRQAKAATSYESVAIVKPANEATVFDNSGNVTVKVTVAPFLRIDAGDRIVLLLDGAPAPGQRDTRFELSGVTRGTHTLQAVITDSRGNTVLSSAPVTFHMWQASKLFPNRRQK